MNLLSVLLDSAPASTGSEQSSLFSFLPIIAIVVIFYFFMIRPQQKKQKEIRKAREAMKPGDKVVTAGGVHARLKEITEHYMVLEIAEGVRIRIDKGSVFAAVEDAK
jgi:preprotein translocase subunit YajC